LGGVWLWGLVLGVVVGGLGVVVGWGGVLGGGGLGFGLGGLVGGGLLVVLVVGWGWGGVWVVLAGELFCRGVMVWLRFEQGGWRHLEV
jgi:hypothetical protein